MAYSINDDFIEAFRNGGCFIFEGEDGQAPGPEEATDGQEAPTEEPAPEAPAEENAEPQTEEQPTEQPAEEQPQQDPATDADPESSAEAVNTDQKADNGVAPTAQKLANDFKAAGNLRLVARTALHDLGITNPQQKMKVEKLVPYITKAVENFASKCSDNYTAADITRAILILTNSCSQKAVDQAKKASAEQTKAAEKQEAPKPTGGDGGAEQQPQDQPEQPAADDVNAT